MKIKSISWFLNRVIYQQNRISCTDFLNALVLLNYAYYIIFFFKNWLSDLEIFATLVAAIVHDFEHTGTTNNFHVMSGSETALLYNDRAVLENHHISAAFRYVFKYKIVIILTIIQYPFRVLTTHFASFLCHSYVPKTRPFFVSKTWRSRCFPLPYRC